MAYISLAMLVRRSIPLLLCLLASAAAVGCGNGDQLMVRGDVTVELPGDANPGFDLPPDTLLEEDYLAAAEMGVFAGRCRTERGGLATIDAEVARPGADAGLTSFSIQANLEGGGTIAALIDGASWEGDGGAACAIETLYLEDDDEMAAVSFDCEVSDGTDTGRAIGELHFAGCTVAGTRD